MDRNRKRRKQKQKLNFYCMDSMVELKNEFYEMKSHVWPKKPNIEMMKYGVCYAAQSALNQFRESIWF